MAPPMAGFGRRLVLVIACAVLGVTAFVPLWGFVVAFAVWVGAKFIDPLVGHLRFDGEPPMATVAVGLALAVAALVFTLVMRLVRPHPPLGFATRTARVGRWMARHPWWVAGAAFVLATRLFASTATALPELATSFGFAVTWWVIFSAVGFGSWATWRAFRWMYAKGLNSTESAVVTSALAASAVAAWVVFGVAAAALIEAARSELRESVAVFAPDQDVVAARLIADAYGELSRGSERLPETSGVLATPGAATAAASVLPASAPESHDDLEACFQSLTPKLHSQARAVAADFLYSTADVEDLIRRTLLNVCLKRKWPDAKPAYFIASIKYGAMRWKLHMDRECPVGELPDACPVDAEDAYPKEQELELMAHVLCRLPEKERELLHLRYFQDLSHREIADRMGSTEGSVRHRVRNAVASARREFSRVCVTGL